MDNHGVIDVGAVDRTEAALPAGSIEEAQTEHSSPVGVIRQKLTVHVRYLALALCCYLVAVSGILISSNFLPYITDNNESFSTLFHASNILRFGLKATAGLTDESNSESPAAHPFVYTHEGNFPRFPALGLLMLGINRIEWQITILAFLVGGLSTYLGFQVFSRIGGDIFAFLTIAVFSTDYLLYAQWQVNTFRVWHALLFFVSLWCIQTINEKNKHTIGTALFLNCFCLFYFEIIFALFTALFSVIYAVTLYRSRPARIAWIAGLIALGGASALGLLLGQLFGYLGTQRAWTDIRLTYLARSFGDTAGGLEGQWRKLHFFIQNHIVYWDSASASNGFPSIQHLYGELRDGVIRVYTPFLVMIIAIISLCLFVSGEACRSVVNALRRTRIARAVREALGSGGVPEWRLLLVSILSVHAIWFLAQSGLYSPSHISLWAGIIRNQWSGMVLQLVLGASLLLGLLMLQGARLYFNRHAEKCIAGVSRYLLSGVAAFILTNAAVPGYVWNGYLARYAPMLVFVTDVWFALMLYALLISVLQTAPVAFPALRVTWGRGGARRASNIAHGPRSSVLLFVVSGFLLLSASLYWMTLQVEYYARLPPTAILFIKQLSRSEFKATSFVSDNYALPVAYFTEQWAYQDQTMPESSAVASDRGLNLTTSGKYIWFADRDTNESYLHPQYYLCRANPDLDIAFALSSMPAGGRLSNCSKERIVRHASSSQGIWVWNTFVARDPSPADMWAIVKLDSKIRFVPKD